MAAYSTLTCSPSPSASLKAGSAAGVAPSMMCCTVLMKAGASATAITTAPASSIAMWLSDAAVGELSSSVSPSAEWASTFAFNYTAPMNMSGEARTAKIVVQLEGAEVVGSPLLVTIEAGLWIFLGWLLLVGLKGIHLNEFLAMQILLCLRKQWLRAREG